ncbi:hypothetical protein BS47DRAFT_1109482 [Hydnum rufescens UP504]|uniref:Uncharacterized protein n=1 Tax=Hydnum rufescens UP504 TaxID=1448309 RepID=A0A9P6AUB6_9AGAM|nr:hypothetical protein BS47DRAFT_1109482 [Hydnum rufescens UP504]
MNVSAANTPMIIIVARSIRDAAPQSQQQIKRTVLYCTVIFEAFHHSPFVRQSAPTYFCQVGCALISAEKYSQGWLAVMNPKEQKNLFVLSFMFAWGACGPCWQMCAARTHAAGYQSIVTVPVCTSQRTSETFGLVRLRLSPVLALFRAHNVSLLRAT